MVQGKYFEEFDVGDRFETQGRTITEADVVNFAGVAGDFNEIHINETYASDTVYGSRIAHGPLVFSVGVGLTTGLSYSQDTLVALYGVDSLRFPNAVRIGDTIHTTQEVQSLESHAEGGIVDLKTTVLNQDGEVCAVWDHRKVLASANDGDNDR